MKIAGLIGFAAVACWLVDSALELPGEPAVGSGLWYFETVVATLALAGSGLFFATVGALIRDISQPTRIAMQVTAVGWWLLAIGGAAMLVVGSDQIGAVGLVFPIGGNLSMLAGLMAAVLFARNGGYTGWRRWAALPFAVAEVVGGQLLSSDESSIPSQAVEIPQHLLQLFFVVAIATGAAAKTAVSRVEAPN